MISDSPIHFYGLPDLRDGSLDLKTWGTLPVERWHARTLLNVTAQNFSRILKEDLIEKCYVLGRERVMLRGLSQTARCLYIEQVFMPDHLPDSQNFLYKQSDIRGAMGCTPKHIYNLVNTGRMIREMLPGGGFRYPHWGMTSRMAIKVREHFLSTNRL